MVRLADGPKASLVPGSPGTGAAAPGKLPGKLNFFTRFTTDAFSESPSTNPPCCADA